MGVRISGIPRSASGLGQIAAALVVGALLLAGCSLLPRDGISREEAIEIAQNQAIGGLGLMVAPMLLDAVVIESSAIEWHGDAPPGRLWVVRFRGMATACGPAPAPGQPPNPCLEQLSDATVYLDFVTGKVISASASPAG